jgi:hypothetical protein
MKRLRIVAGIFALAVPFASAGCGGSSSSINTPTTPAPTTFTETFSGSLMQGQTDFGPADSPHHFTIQQAGNIDATLTDIQPLNTITLGLGLGVWDSTANTCTLQVSSNAAKLNLTLAASVSVPGELCVGIFDVGNISTDTVNYTVVIHHT